MTSVLQKVHRIEQISLSNSIYLATAYWNNSSLLMNRSKVGQKQASSGKPIMKQKSIASFFSQTRRKKSTTSEIKTHASTQLSQSQSKLHSGTSSIKNFKRTTSTLIEGTSPSRPIMIGMSKPKLSRTPTNTSSLFQSQGSFDEYDPNKELKRLMSESKLNNFKSSEVTSLSRMPSFQKSNSIISDFGSPSVSSSPTKTEHILAQVDNDSFRETTQISTAARQLTFTSSTQIDSPVKSDYFPTPTLSQSSSFLFSQPSSTPTQTKPAKRTNSLQSLNLSNAKRMKPLAKNPRTLHAKKITASKSNSIVLNLTKEQQYVIDLVVQKKQNVFYTGSAGTGKSVILSNIVGQLQKLYGKEAVAITASTGLAAATIGGITLHKWSHAGIGAKSADLLARQISKRRDATMTWRNTKVLIIDEISMIDGRFLTKLEYIARVVRKNDRPFGGIQLVFTGDFFQLPPVSSSMQSNASGEGQAIFCFESETWKRCIQKTILLTKVFRQQDNELIDILNCIRFGDIEKGMATSIRKLERKVEYNDGIMPTEIYATRREVEVSNKRQLSDLPGDEHKFVADDLVTKSKAALLDQAVMAEKELVLKEDAQVMMLKNKPDVEIFNGTLGKVLFFTTQRLATKFIDMFQYIDNDVINDMRLVSKAIGNRRIKELPSFVQELRKRDARHYGKLEEMVNYAMNETLHEPSYPFVRWSIGRDKHHHELVVPEAFPVDLPGEPTAMQRTQLPIMLCWALSIHKAQGQTIPRLKVDLKNIFEAGQVYVALSRAVSKDCLQVTNFQPGKIRSNGKVKEFYKGLETVSH